MISVKREDFDTYFEWYICTTNRWCSYVVQKYFYECGVVLEEFDEDGDILCKYILEGFPIKSLPYFNQEKDTISVITLKEKPYEKVYN